MSRASAALSEAQRARLLERAGPRVVAVAQDARSQARNRELALARLRRAPRAGAARAAPAPPDAPDGGLARASPGGKRRTGERKARRRPPRTRPTRAAPTPPGLGGPRYGA